MVAISVVATLRTPTADGPRPAERVGSHAAAATQAGHNRYGM